VVRATRLHAEQLRNRFVLIPQRLDCLGTGQPPIQRVPGLFSWEYSRQGIKFCLHNAKCKNALSCEYVLTIPQSFMAWCLIRHRDNFIFFYLQALNLALLIVCMEIAVKMSRSLFVPPPHDFIFWLMTPCWGWLIFWFFSTICCLPLLSEVIYTPSHLICNTVSSLLCKVKQSRYRPGVAQRFPGS
jgi:hypothetical protein